MLRIFGEKISVYLWAFAFGLLLLAQNASAQPNINLTTEFTSADPARTNTYMDAGGVWNGVSDVTNTTGDLFRLILANTAPGPAPADTAFDVAASINVPAGFRLPQSPYTVIVTEQTGNPACPVIANTSATQPGGTGTVVNLNLLANTDIEAGCTYAFQFGLTAETSVVGDTYQLIHSYSYNVTDDTPATEVADSGIQAVEVRVGDVITLKSAVDNAADPLGAYAPGETAEWNVRVRSSGLGGAFDVVLTDVLGPDFGATTPTIAYVSGPTGTLVGNQFTIPYMDPSTETVLNIQAVVPTFSAAQCPDLRNTGSVTDRVGNTDSTFDSATYELDNPLLSYTAPNINVAFGAGPQNLSIPLQNVGDGLAQNVTLNVTGLVGIIIDINEATSPGWTFNGLTGPVTATGNDNFAFNAALAAGQVSNINFTAEVDGAICPAANTGALNWTPDYQNICSTSFQPPLAFTNSSITNEPDLQVQKTASAGAINIGQTGFYNITFTGTNIAGLPSDGNTANNNEFTVTDTLPVNLTNVVINTMPAGTAVLVNGLPYTAGNPIPDNATITWTGDQEDLTPIPTLQVDYTVNPLTCPAGQTVTNTATLDYPGCTINNNDAAGFIANDNPAGGATTNFTALGGGTYEAGAPDTDGIAGNEINEGEHIQFQAEYVFPPGFAGTWSNSTYNATLGAGALVAGSPDLMRLIQNPVAGSSAVFVEVFDSGLNTVFASTAVLDSNITGGDGTAALTINNFDYIGVALGNDNLSPGYTLRITYTVTVPEGNTTAGLPDDDVNIGGTLENATLTVNGGPLSCLGNTEFVQGVNVNIVRADITIGATLNAGQPVGVCEIVPLTLDITDPGGNPDNGAEADNLRLRFDQSSFEFVDAAGNDGDPTTDITYAGSLLPLTVDGTEVANDVFMTVNPATQNINAAGSATFNVRLRDRLAPAGSVTGELIAEVNFDSNHTSIDNAADNDRDYSNLLNNTPTILEGQLDMEFQPPAIFLIDQSTYSWTVTVTNVGTGTSYNAEFTNTLPTGMTPNVGSSSVDVNAAAPVISGGGQTMTWQLGDLPPGGSFNITVAADIDQTTCFQGGGENISSEALWGCGLPPISISEGAEPSPRIELPTFQLQLQHDATDSFCELCGDGEIRLLVNNSGSVELSNITITEDLRVSGLTYQPSSTDVVVGGVTFTNVPLLEPTISGASNQLLTWDMADIITAVNSATPGTFTSTSGLVSGFTTGAGNPQSLELVFRVDSPGESLVIADRTIQASSTFDLFCGPHLTGPATSGLFTLPLREPIPVIEKQIRNTDAGQPVGTFVDDVSIANGDGIIWRLNISNNGNDDLEALRIIDTLLNAPFNMDFTAICSSEADAENHLNSIAAPACVTLGNLSSYDNATNITAFLDNRLNYIPAGNTANIYIAGTVFACNNDQNQGQMQWGCDAETNGANLPGTLGGLTASAAGGEVIIDTADSNGLVNSAGVTINYDIVGRGSTEPGSKGFATITIDNEQTNGTLANLAIDFSDQLPNGYIIDNASLNATVTPRFGTYRNIITDVTNVGTSTNPVFNFIQDQDADDNGIDDGTGLAIVRDLLRGGDSLEITFTIIQNSNFDTAADPETRQEQPPLVTAFDPAVIAPSTSTLRVDYTDSCGSAVVGSLTNTALLVSPDPEDLDIDINSATNPNGRADADLFFLLNDPAPNLNLDVEVTNNGGNSATDYAVYVVVGSGLSVVTLPADCALLTGGSPAGDVANLPALAAPAVPGTATAYTCQTTDPLPSSQRDIFEFVVGKQGAGADLTFRADVIGRVTLNDGTDFNPPLPAGVSDTNDYSFDNILARIIGFTLTQTLQSCTEATSVNPLVVIGEDCTYRIESGWFGFATPGFGNLDVRNVTITEDLPDGQGYISDDTSASTAGVITVNSTTPVSPIALLTETDVSWNLANVTNDGNFVADLVVRTLNDALNATGGDNNHADIETLLVDASFDVFDINAGTTILNFNPAAPGYPPDTNRRVDITIAEPSVSVVKDLCNETVAGGVGSTCGLFGNTTQGDEDDVYTYRLQVTNAVTTGGVQHATAFDLVINDTMDAVDRMLVRDPATDGIDNDGDGNTDAADLDGEGTLTTDGTADNGVPDQIQFNLDTLANTGVAVEYYYRADPFNTVVPGEQLTNTVNVTYDSLPGASGSQTAGTEQVSGTVGGARQTTSPDATAIYEVTPLIVNAGSKRYPRISRRDDPGGPVVGAPGPCAAPCVDQDVVIGEEVEVELEFQIPVATLNNFTLTDNLPDGLLCTEAQSVTLPPANFDATPPLTGPGTFAAATCNANIVEWNFGNQRLLNGAGDGDGDDNVYTFTATFIARVQNIATNQNGVTLSNGGDNALPNDGPQGPTVVQVSYENASGVTFTRVLGQADLNIVEPQITIVKQMGVLNGAPPPLVTPATNADASDIVWVEVVIDNAVGAAPLHAGLRVYDDLSVVDSLTFNSLQVGSLVDIDLVTRGANQPIFTFDNVPGFYPINAGETRRFAFSINIANTVEPQEILDNTIQAAWLSLPNNTVALNATGSIGANGADDGLRAGRLDFDPVLTVQNDYSDTNTNNTMSVPPPQIVKTDISAGALVNTIGARRQYQVQITLPEAITQNLTLQDNLNTGSGNLVIENEAAFPIVYSCSGIATINATAVNCADSATIAAALTAAPVDEAGGIINWNIGNVVTQTEDDNNVNAINPSITIQYLARVANTVDSVAGNTVQNSATSTFIDGEAGGVVTTAASATAAVAILEPDLIVNLTGPAIINSGDSGVFTATVLNPNAGSTPASTTTSTAWDTTIDIQLGNLDPSAGGLCDTDPLSLVAPTLQITDTLSAVRPLTAGIDYTATFLPAPACTLRFVLTPNTIAGTIAGRLDAGDTLSIQYNAQVDGDSPDAATVTTIAGATEWFSQDTDGVSPAVETRRYTRALSNGTVGVNDHEDAHDIATQSAILAITKTLLTPIGTINPGDTVSYQLSINNSGVVGSSGFQILDDLGALNAPESYFVPGSLVIDDITDADPIPTDDDLNNSSAVGGTNNQGLVNISNLDIDATGGLVDTVIIQYSATLRDVIPNATQVRNQATAQGTTIRTTLSNINSITITSMPDFTFDKTATDINGGALAVGDRIQYTLRVENTGNENAINVSLFDAIPANTRYVTDSVTLNGQPVARPDNGVSPLEAGILINSPDNATAGFMTADTTVGNQVAVVTFDVIIESNLINGTVISNQGRITGQGEGGLAFEPAISDDPATPIINDPTQVIVGGGVLLDAQKTVQDINGGDVQNGDTLRYTIVVQNNGTADATAVSFEDNLPAGTTYVANSASLNGNPIVGATLPFDVAGGLDISSSNLPIPTGTADAIITQGQAATIVFDVNVNIATGVISNQGTVRSNEQPDELTDVDGNDENGDQPTVVQVGAVQELNITKEVVILGGGVASPGRQLQYIIRVENNGSIAASDIIITDTIPASTSYIANSAQLNGLAAGTSFTANTITANYGAVYGTLAPGASLLLSFNVNINADAVAGNTISNTANLSWNAATRNASDTANIDVGGAPGVANINGTVWLDADHNNIIGEAANESLQAGWIVETFFGNGTTPVGSTITDANGAYSLNGFAPGAGYRIQFSFPGSNVDLGETISTTGTPVQMQTTAMTLAAGRNIQNESLPLDPNGVVYNSITRQPLAGVGLTLLTSAGTPVNSICFNDADMQGQITADNGFYAFDLNFGAHPDCTGTQTYTISYSTYPADVFEQISEIIPPQAGSVDVINCPVDTVTTNAANTCDIQPQATAPISDISQGPGTAYYLSITLNDGPAERLFANHLPIDPMLNGILGISKTTPLKNVVRGQLVPYTIVLTDEALGVTLRGLEIRDTMPPGFKYVAGSATVESSLQERISQEPLFTGNSSGREVIWNNITLPANESVELRMLLVVGSGVGTGEYINTAQAFVSILNDDASGIGSATVRVIPDPVFDCSDIIGKVFDDKNADGYQNKGEVGIGGVRVVSAKGLITTTDKHGRYHITCAAVPNEQRGTNFILKVDERSLPSGYRMTTENPRVIKLTRGKAVKFNFGASIHRVVRIDLHDAAFIDQQTELKDYWKPTLNKLYEQLQKGPSVLRLSYLGDIESEKLAVSRLNHIRSTIEKKWNALACCYNLTIETELYWRRGKPVSVNKGRAK